MGDARAVAVDSLPVRVLIVDDHEVVCQGVAALLGHADDISVCGWATSAASALEAAEREHPDVVTMDIRLGDGCGIETAREIRARRPATKVLMLTSFADDEALLASIMAGASGFLLKQVRGTDLGGAIRSVASGLSLIDQALVASLFERLGTVRQPADEKLSRLSPQEGRVLAEVAAGKTNKEISQGLFISEKTVKNHLSHVLAKLEVSRRAEAAVYLTRHGTSRPGAGSLGHGGAGAGH